MAEVHIDVIYFTIASQICKFGKLKKRQKTEKTEADRGLLSVRDVGQGAGDFLKF